jgi:hypothetical protein
MKNKYKNPSKNVSLPNTKETDKKKELDEKR